MPEYDENDTEIEEEPEGIRGIRQAKKAAEAEQERLKAELSQAQDAVKELAFLKAGLPEDSKTAAYFRSTYQGDLTAEAIKAAAIEAGIIPETSPEVTSSIQAQTQMASAMTGGQSPQYGEVQVGPDYARIAVPAEQADKWTEFEAALKSGPMGAQKAADVLRRYGDEVGVGPTDPLSTSPNTTPLANQANRII